MHLGRIIGWTYRPAWPFPMSKTAQQLPPPSSQPYRRPPPPRLPPGRPRATTAYRLAWAILAMMLVVSLDFRDYFDKSGSTARYGLLLIPIGGVLVARLRRRSTLIRRWSAPDRLLFVLMMWGILGSLYGKAHDHTASGALPVFMPMIVAFTYLLADTAPTPRECVRILNGLSIVGVVYAFMNSIANAGAGFIAAKTYRNSKILYV